MENLEDILVKIGELTSTKQLKEKDLLVNPVVLKAEKSYPITIPDVTFSIGLGAAASVQLFNDEDDVDDDDLIGKVDKPIPFSPLNDAYLKYSALVAAKANGSTDLPSIGFDFESSLELRTGYYSKHANTEQMGNAFTADIKEFLTLFKWEDVEKLGVNDALYFKAVGKIKSNLSLSWSNIFTQSLGALTKVLPGDISLDVQISPSLTAEFAVEIDDNFTYVVRKVSQTRCYIALNKSKSQKKTGGVSASVGVKFADPKKVEKQLEQLRDLIIRSVFKTSINDIDKAIKAVKDHVATALQNKIVEAVAKILGLTGVIDSIIASIETKWESIKEAIKTGIGKVAEFNASLSFSYEYEMIKEGKELLSLNIDLASLKPYHPKLLRFNPEKLLSDLRASTVSGVSDISYANQNDLTVKKSWGFGLTLFDSTFFSGKDFTDDRVSERIDLLNHEQIAIENSAGYKWKLGQSSGTWLSQFTASMKSYSANVMPVMSEFDFSIYLNMVHQDSKVKESELRKYLDTGVLWKCLAQSDVDAFVSNYGPKLLNKKVTFETKISLSPMASKIILLQIGKNGWNDMNKMLMAKSMAASMSYWDSFSIRDNVDGREKSYTNLWLDYLTDPGQSTSDLAYKAYDELRKIPGIGGLAQLEKNAGHNNAGMCFADVIYTNPGIFNDSTAYIKGAVHLQGNINSNAAFGKLPVEKFRKQNRVYESYSEMQQFFTQSFYVKTLGSFLLRYIELNPLLKKEVTKGLAITYSEAGAQQVINLTII